MVAGSTILDLSFVGLVSMQAGGSHVKPALFWLTFQSFAADFQLQPLLCYWVVVGTHIIAVSLVSYSSIQDKAYLLWVETAISPSVSPCSLWFLEGWHTNVFFCCCFYFSCKVICLQQRGYVAWVALRNNTTDIIWYTTETKMQCQNININRYSGQKQFWKGGFHIIRKIKLSTLHAI